MRRGFTELCTASSGTIHRPSVRWQLRSPCGESEGVRRALVWPTCQLCLVLHIGPMDRPMLFCERSPTCSEAQTHASTVKKTSHHNKRAATRFFLEILKFPVTFTLICVFFFGIILVEYFTEMIWTVSVFFFFPSFMWRERWSAAFWCPDFSIFSLLLTSIFFLYNFLIFYDFFEL